MEADSSNFSFHIKKQAIMDKKYFVYHDEKYPIDFDLLKKNSRYFYQNQGKFKNVQNIELINEEQEHIKLSDESIKAFISCCQNEPCSINKSSVIPLQYLANKFEFVELIQITDKYINDHSQELIFPILLSKNYENVGNISNNSFFDTSKEEKIISNHLQEFIQKDEMLSLPIPLLYRIFKLFYNDQQNKENLKSDMTNFLFKCLDKYGKKASVLFSLVDFGEQRVEIVQRLLQNYSQTFDFNLINQTLTKTVTDLINEMQKQKEEYTMMFQKMQDTFNEQLAILNKMQKEEDQRQIQNEIENQKRIQKVSTDIEKIKSDVDEKMVTIEDKFGQICKKQEDFIDNNTVKKYRQATLQLITIGDYRQFDDQLKDHIINELFTIENRQYQSNEILHFKEILNDLFIPENDNVHIIQIFNMKSYDQIKMNIVNNFILLEIKYPSEKFQQNMKIISDIKSKYQSIKISLWRICFLWMFIINTNHNSFFCNFNWILCFLWMFIINTNHNSIKIKYK